MTLSPITFFHCAELCLYILWLFMCKVISKSCFVKCLYWLIRVLSCWFVSYLNHALQKLHFDRVFSLCAIGIACYDHGNGCSYKLIGSVYLDTVLRASQCVKFKIQYWIKWLYAFYHLWIRSRNRVWIGLFISRIFFFRILDNGTFDWRPSRI